MNRCKKPHCGSWAINHHSHGRDGSDDDLCDVCYWRKRATEAVNELRRLAAVEQKLEVPQANREPLTYDQIAAATGTKPGTPMWLIAVAFTRAIEAAHGITKGRA